MGPLTLAVGLQALLLWLKWLELKKKKGIEVKTAEKAEKPRPLELRQMEV